MPPVLRRAIALAGLSALSVIGLQTRGVQVAQAHDNTVTGVAACQKDGTYTVAWYIKNSNTDETEAAMVLGQLPGGSSVSPSSVAIPAYNTRGVVQTGIPGNSRKAAIGVRGHWYPDNFQKDAYGVVDLPGTCTRPATAVAPQAPAVEQSVCKGGHPTSPVLAARSTRGIHYTVSSSGPYVAGQKVTVVAQATPGHRLAAAPGWTTVGNRASRTVAFDQAPTCAGVAAKQASRPGASGPLANTGPHTTAMLLTGLGSVLLGAAMLALARRRTV